MKNLTYGDLPQEFGERVMNLVIYLLYEFIHITFTYRERLLTIVLVREMGIFCIFTNSS